MNDIEFCRWEGDCFGYSYGTGEEFIIRALQRFFARVPSEGTYDHEKIGPEIGNEVMWLLINVLCRQPRDERLARDCVIEYGTSPRFGWLTDFGKELKAFVCGKRPDELLEILSKYEAIEDPVYGDDA